MPRPLVPSLPVQAGPPPEVDRSARPAYNTIITKDAKTRVGMFKTHRIGDRLLFEIPPRELGVDMLVVGRYARAAADAGWMYGGDEFTERTVRWERVGNRVLLRSPSFAVMADTALPVYRAVQAGNYASIIATFEIQTFGPDSAPVIDVTRLFVTGIPELSAMRGGGVDPARSYIESALAYPTNIEIEATQTGAPTGAPTPETPSPQAGARSVLAHWSMIHLPDVPMRARQSDERVGYFNVSRLDFGTNQFRSVEQRFITRWRLDKKEPSAAMSEPVNPIVYYIDPATPDQWRPWIRQAVLDWAPAFEAAGFKNAIQVKEPPTDDPDWSPDDVRHTMIRWLPSATENAVGPYIADPRTGEILNGSIRIFHNVLNLQRDWYYTQVGPLDERARSWPMPDSLMGRLLQYVVSHEIGHTLGLRHNQIASSLYPAESLRVASWVHRMGSAPSIMDYSRYNYVAQPEDHIAPADLIPRVGPYDRFAIQWGYTPIPSSEGSDDERMTLDRWASAQDSVPWLRFAEWNPAEFGTLPEAVGDADPVWSTGWGMKNLARVMQMLPTTTLRPGQTNDDLAELYAQTVQQWQTEMGHVVSVVGGATVQFKSGSQRGAVYTPLSRDRQQAAVRFLNTHAFTTPRFLIDPRISRRLEPDGMITRINSAQDLILSSLFNDARLSRLVEYRAINNDASMTYSLGDLLADLRQGIWSELSSTRVDIDPFRRALQGSYLTQVAEQLSRGGAYSIAQGYMIFSRGNQASSAARAAFRTELDALRMQVDAAIPRAANAETRTHLLAVHNDIGRLLEPAVGNTSTSSGGGTASGPSVATH